MKVVSRIQMQHEDIIHDVSYDYYGKRLATCSSDQKIKIWDQNEKSPGEWVATSEWKAHSGSIWKICWAHPEFGQVIASCSFDRSVCIWEEEEEKGGIKRWTKRATLVDSRDSVHDIRFAPRHMGLKLAACSSDGFVRIYEAVDINNLSLWSLMDEIEVQKLSFTSILSIPPNSTSGGVSTGTTSGTNISASLTTSSLTVATSTNINPGGSNTIGNTSSNSVTKESIALENQNNLSNYNSMNINSSLKGSSNSLTDKEKEALSAANIANNSSNSSSNTNIAISTTSNTCSCICWNPSPLDPRPMIIIGTGNPVYTSYSTSSNISVALTSASANVLSNFSTTSSSSTTSTNPISNASPSPNTFDSNNNTSTARIYEYNEQTRKWVIIESLNINSPILDLSWAPNVGRTYHLIATASKDKKVKIWKLQTQSTSQSVATRGPSSQSTPNPSANTRIESKEVVCFEDHHAEVWRTEWNITGTILASSGDDGTVRLYKSNLQNDWKCVSVIGGDDNI